MYNFTLCATRSPYKLSEHCSVSADVRQKLKDFQLSGVQFLYDHRQQFCILNDESGLGKTVTLAVYLGAVLNKQKCLIIVGDDNSLANWEYHLNVLTTVDVTVVKTTEIPAVFDDSINSHIFVISWSVLFRNEISKHAFDIIVVDNRTNVLDNIFCRLFLSKTYEKKVNIYVSSVDVMRDVKLLHFVLRLGGRLESELASLKKFEEKFKLPKMIDLKSSVDLEEYILKRQILKDYCGDFTLRRYRHQFNERFPLTESEDFKLHLELWRQNNQIRERHIMKVQHRRDNQDENRTGLTLANINTEIRANSYQSNTDREETDEVCNMSPLVMESESEDDENGTQCKELETPCIVLDSDSEMLVEVPKGSSNPKDLNDSEMPQAIRVKRSDQDAFVEKITAKYKSEKIKLKERFKIKVLENYKSKHKMSLGLWREKVRSVEVSIEEKISVEARPERKKTIETIAEGEKISENMPKHENIRIEKISEEKFTDNRIQVGIPKQKTSKEKASRDKRFEENKFLGEMTHVNQHVERESYIEKIPSEEGKSIGKISDEKGTKENKSIVNTSKENEYNKRPKEKRSPEKKSEGKSEQNKSLKRSHEKMVVGEITGEKTEKIKCNRRRPIRKTENEIRDQSTQLAQPLRKITEKRNDENRHNNRSGNKEKSIIRNMEKVFINGSSSSLKSPSQETICNNIIYTNMQQKRSEVKRLKTFEKASSVAHGPELRSRKKIAEKIAEKNSNEEKVTEKESSKRNDKGSINNAKRDSLNGKRSEPMVARRKSRRKTVDPSVEPKILRSTRLTTRSGRILHISPFPKKQSKTRKKLLVKSNIPHGHTKIPKVASREFVLMSSSEYDAIECAQKLSGDFSLNSRATPTRVASSSENMWNTSYTIRPSISLSRDLDMITIPFRSSTGPTAPLNVIELSGSSLDSLICLSTPKVKNMKSFLDEQYDQLAWSPDLFTSNGITSGVTAPYEYAQHPKVLNQATAKQTDRPAMNISDKCDTNVVQKKLNVEQTRQGPRPKQHQTRKQYAVSVKEKYCGQIRQDAGDRRQVVENKAQENGDSKLKALVRRQDIRSETTMNRLDTNKMQEAASWQQVDNTQHGVATIRNDIDENIQIKKISRYIGLSSQSARAPAGTIDLLPNRKAKKAKQPNQSNKLTRWLLRGSSKVAKNV